MNKLFFFLTSALLLACVVVAGSAQDKIAAQDKSADKKAAVPAPKADDTKSPPSTPPSGGTTKETKPTEAKPAETKPAAPGVMPAEVIERKSIPDEATDKKNACIKCHTDPELWDKSDPANYKYYIPLKALEALKNDVHWQKGLRCQDCHGGNEKPDDPDNRQQAHFGKNNFHVIKSPADIPGFCGRCHSSIAYMKLYSPSPRTDQLAEYWTSGHGEHLKKGDMKVATCISCHDQPHGNGIDQKPHGIRPVHDPSSPVYHTNVAKTCAKCHSDKDLMKEVKAEYKGKPLPCDEYDNWKKSVHGKALLEKGDLSAPTCNNCHGNHGAAPPQMNSVANACGACHGKIAKLFEGSKMRQTFETEHLPGCAACHSNHLIREPTDDFLGMNEGAFCARCHTPGKEQHGATPAGAKAAETIHADLQRLKDGIQKADETLTDAEIKGMEVSEPKFNLHKATDALTDARTEIHTFNVDVVEKALAPGEKVVKEVQEKADHALEEYKHRRYWLAISLVPILIVIGLLVLYIRTLPIPEKPADPEDQGGVGK